MALDKENHPPAEEMFQDVTHVMVGKKNIAFPEDYDLVRSACMPYVDEHFAAVAESKWWKLYRRKDPLPPTGP